MDEIAEKLQELIDQNEDGKVTFTFRQNDPEVKLIVNRHKLVEAIDQLYDYKRGLEKYSDPNEIIVDERTNEIVKDDDSYDPENANNRHTYIKESAVTEKIDDILDIAYSIVYDYLYNS